MTREKALQKVHDAVGHLCRKIEAEIGRGPTVCMTIDYFEAMDVLSRPVIELSAYDLVLDQETIEGTAPLRYEGWEGDRVVVLNRKVK